MSYSFDAILKVGGEKVKMIEDGKAYDENGDEISLDTTALETAQKEVEDERDATLYQRKRSGREDSVAQYPPIADQLDMLWHDIDTGKLDKTGTFYDAIKKVKDAVPKPSS
jgi:isocitrate lyase